MAVQRAADTGDGPTTADVDDGDPPPGVVASIVVIADENSVWSDQIARYLTTEGFLVLVDRRGDSAFDQRARAADAVLLDLGLTARSATDVCVAWCERSKAPILAVAPVRDEALLLAAYAAGADHVAPIDITARQLLARLRSLLRRSPSRRRRATEPALGSAPIVLDPDRRVALVDTTSVPLTRQEFEFLELLLDRAGRVVERSELVTAVHPAPPSERAIDFFVRRLREKLESVDGQRRITTVRGVGFRFDVRSTSSADAPA